MIYVLASSTDQDLRVRAAQLVTEIEAARYTRAVLVDPDQRRPME